MKYTQIYLTYVLVSATITMHATTEPVDGIQPSGTLPILYITTENNVPIDQKETYIKATYWLDASMCDEYESIGSKDKPLPLGIRGRGNITWLHDGQKPYKLKLDKKQDLLKMGKNKHWALLAKTSHNQVYNEQIGFEIGRKLGMGFVPEAKYVELVLNDVYYGMYALTETIRVDNTRVNIFEQPDLCEDEDVIPSGWLVEIDNNSDPYQVRIDLPDGSVLRITHKTPEETNSLQDIYLKGQFRKIVEAISTENKFDRTWEEYLDIDALARHFLVEEMLHNFDAYTGSCYINKDVDSKWTFGPLWDLGWSCDRTDISELICEQPRQQLIGDIWKFPTFRKRVKEIYDTYMSESGRTWIEPFVDALYQDIKAGLAETAKVWPYQLVDRRYDYTLMCLNSNLDYLDRRINEDCITYTLTQECIKIGPVSEAIYVDRTYDGTITELNEDTDKYNDSLSESVKLPSEIRINGLNINNVVVLKNMSVEITALPEPGYRLERILVNGEDFTDKMEDNKLILDSLYRDTHVQAVFESKFNLNTNSIDNITISNSKPEIKICGNTLSVFNSDSMTIYNMSGETVYSGRTVPLYLPQKGIYFVKTDNSATKIYVR